ncbi:hypothetical protein AKJ16_DCAP18533 [Drosera capensis]
MSMKLIKPCCNVFNQARITRANTDFQAVSVFAYISSNLHKPLSSLEESYISVIHTESVFVFVLWDLIIDDGRRGRATGDQLPHGRTMEPTTPNRQPFQKTYGCGLHCFMVRTMPVHCTFPGRARKETSQCHLR